MWKRVTRTKHSISSDIKHDKIVVAELLRGTKHHTYTDWSASPMCFGLQASRNPLVCSRVRSNNLRSIEVSSNLFVCSLSNPPPSFLHTCWPANLKIMYGTTFYIMSAVTNFHVLRTWRQIPWRMCLMCRDQSYKYGLRCRMRTDWS